MDCADTFNKLPEKLGLPELVQTQLKLREFTTASSLYWALSMGAEENLCSHSQGWVGRRQTVAIAEGMRSVV